MAFKAVLLLALLVAKLSFGPFVDLAIADMGHPFQDGPKLDQEAAIEYRKIIEDKEHIQQEFNHAFPKDQIRKMTSEEMAFNWFRGHDTDFDGVLDGLELYKAIHHSKSHSQDEQHSHGDSHSSTTRDRPSPPKDDDPGAAWFVDQLLDGFDQDRDGRLDFQESFASFGEARSTLMAEPNLDIPY